MNDQRWILVLVAVTAATGIVFYGVVGYILVHFVLKYW